MSEHMPRELLVSAVLEGCRDLGIAFDRLDSPGRLAEYLLDHPEARRAFADRDAEVLRSGGDFFHERIKEIIEEADPPERARPSYARVLRAVSDIVDPTKSATWESVFSIKTEETMSARFGIYLEFDADGEQDAEYAAGRAAKALEDENRDPTWGELGQKTPHDDEGDEVQTSTGEGGSSEHVPGTG